MKKYTFFSTAKSVPIFALCMSAILIFSSCDNSTGPDDDHEHSDPEGIELIHDGEVIIRYLDQEVTELEHLHYHVGEEYHFDVEFLDEHGDHIHAEDYEDGYSLVWDIEDESIFEIEQHEEDGRWSFHLVPLAEGASKVQFILNHGDHSHFSTPGVENEGAIEIHVDAEDDDHDDDH